jgi:hypothetical protein
MLTLSEEILILCIHEDKGTIMPSKVDSLRYGLGGAMLADLALIRKIGLKDNQRLELLDATPVEDDIQADALEIIRNAEKERKMGYWIDVFSQKPEKLRKRLANRLVEDQVVNQEDDRFQWVMPHSDALNQNATAKYLMRSRIRDLVLASAHAEPREIALLSLVKASNLLDLIFFKDERKLADQRINELVVGEAMKNPAIQTIQAIAAAIEAVVEED